MLFVVILVVTLLLYYIKLKYYTFRGPLPGLPPHFLFGNLIQSGILLGNVSRPDALLAFKARYGDIFQFWAGPTRVIVVSNINDVQHIFTHRHIYDQGDLTIQTFGVLFPDGLICNKGPFASLSN
ncbi:unnamed protein product [Rotaria sp. Silwood2]|nr:unnamed protein product [Rotaria sp. Silwood2]CAF2999629.1 unnamed protein product [Rotaria sp. Silwood2]CAF3396475.1 unnamed protein product [Rotaria sp. Silwood2]CAF4102601.1 unnamed protein product [Rotaria sp. Silwood2]CAF4232221.1 unnamed protein product [Rotaria sp. Silwood2]